MSGIRPFCKISTKRTEYQRQEFTIVVDSCYYKDDPNFNYQICEIELLVNSPKEIDSAEQKIVGLLKKLGFKINPVQGKIIYFFRKKYPDIFNYLSGIYGF